MLLGNPWSTVCGATMRKVVRSFRANRTVFISLVSFLILWQLLVTVFGVKSYIIPSPIDTFGRLLDPAQAANYQWPKHIGATLTEILISFGATGAAGILVALVITWSNTLKKIITPVLTIFNSIPKIALAPLFLLWFGYGIVPNVAIAMLIAFFPIVINTATGLSMVDEELLDLVRYLNASKLQIFVKIRIPNSLPYIFSGLKISTTLCVVGAIVGEFVASTKGLGFLIKDSQALIDTPTMFAALILISILGLSLFAFISFLERTVMPWQHVSKGGE